MLLVYMGLAFLTNPQFAVLVMIGGGVSNLLYKQIYKLTKAASAKITKGGHVFQGQMIQLVSNFKYLKATGFLENYGKKLKSSIVYIEESQKKIGLYSTILTATREPLNIMVVVAVIAFQVKVNHSSMSEIILSLLFFYRALNFVMQLQTAWNSFLNNSGALENMTQFNAELTSNKETFGKINLSQIKKNRKYAYKY